MIDWSLLGPPVDVGAHFQAGLARGQAVRKQSETQSALAAFAANPDDPNAIGALMAVDPEMGMQYQAKQIDQRRLDMKAQADTLEANRANIVKGAQIFRQVNPTDEAGYQRARQLAQQMGIDVSQVPPNFDPNYVKGVVDLADTFEPEKQASEPSVVQSFKYRQGLPTDQQGQFDQFQRNARPQIFGSAESGYNVYDPNNGGGQQGGGLPQVSSPEEAASLPPGSQFTLPDGRIGTVPGGAGGNTSGGFPDPLAPR